MNRHQLWLFRHEGLTIQINECAASQLLHFDISWNPLLYNLHFQLGPTLFTNSGLVNTLPYINMISLYNYNKNITKPQNQNLYFLTHRLKMSLRIQFK